MRRVVVGLGGVLVILILYCTGIWWTEKDDPSFPQNRAVTYSGNGYMVTTNGEIDLDNEGMTHFFEVGADIAGAKRLLPELLVPGYIPEGYVFQELSVSTYMSGRWVYAYTYVSETNKLEIRQKKDGEVTVEWEGSEDEKAEILAGVKE